MKTIFELKQDMTTIGNQIQKTKDEISQKAADPAVSVEELNQLNKTSEELQQRFDIIKAQHDQMETEQKASLSKQSFSTAEDPKQKLIDAKAALIRATMKKDAVSKDAMDQLNQSYDNNIFQALIDDTSTGGKSFIPKNTGTSVISDPVVKNPLRGLSAITTIPNLELPKVTFTLDDDDFIEDGQTAKELKATGSVVTFGRHKFKVFTDLSETVVNGTNTDLVSTVEQNLQGGVAFKEKKVAFSTTPKTGEEHMSFYDETVVNIKKIEAETLFESIIQAAADLEDNFAENAVVAMRKADYYSMIKDLANGAESLFGKKPEEVLGYPTVFIDKAVTPVVGDFSYSHYNYDINALYEQDKNVKTGMHSFVVTAWFDHQIKLASAFRLATVKKA
ncbi:phage major capsid protein [Enterococcus thailandicus]|uniref:phage major capsid protein n=1 Tax=Enterococcus thailandicus TaxID=417368 RepID=UPI00244D983C|nr:phage major capsid protein [Enterococcus thailandicus]GMC01784.1 phage capsid protein [Enterococcus thailandicus]